MVKHCTALCSNPKSKIQNPKKGASMTDTKSVSIKSLITVPALITLGITILRLVGELQHWPKLLFNPEAGGGGAIVGISWLPIIFGPYFALKLAGAGDGPSSTGKSIGLAFLGFVVYFLAIWWAESTFRHPSALSLIPLLVTLAAAFIPRIGWRSFGNTLIAYAFAARIPVLIVMLLALAGNGGQGWGTHYDAVMPQLAQASLGKKFLIEAFVPQMTMWIGWTVAVGSVVGAMVAAVARRGKQAAPAPAA
jgi:hypothetical protein